MANHLLKVAARWDIDHSQTGISVALDADLQAAGNLAEAALKLSKASAAIEYIMFDNNTRIQDRILAIYFIGQKSVTRTLSVKDLMSIIQKKMEGKDDPPTLTR